MEEVKFNVDFQKDINNIIDECPAFVKFIENPNDDLIAKAIDSGYQISNYDEGGSIFDKKNLFGSTSSKIQIALVNNGNYFYSKIKYPTDELIEHVIKTNAMILLDGKNKKYKTEKKFIDLAVEYSPKFAANYLNKQITAKQFIDMVRSKKIYYHEKERPGTNELVHQTRYRLQNDARYSGIRAKQMTWRDQVKITRKFSNKEFAEIPAIKLTIRANPWLILCLNKPSKEYQVLAARKLQKIYGLDNVLTDKDAIEVFNGYKACEDIIA